MHKQTLSKNWKLKDEPIHHGPEYAPVLRKLSVEDAGWIDTAVPSDVHQAYIANGRIADPVIGLESFECEWLEERSFWYKSSFRPTEEIRTCERIELVCESLDAEADLFLNGVHLGHHRSSFYPFEKNVGGLLQEGDNELLIRLTTGLEGHAAADVAPYGYTVSESYRRGDKRRVLARKPQYSFGWDWGPRIATCGIVGEVHLVGYSKVAVRGCTVETVSATDIKADITVTVEAENLHIYQSTDARVSCEFRMDGVAAATAVTDTHVQSGTNYLTLELTVENPELWWPNGWGSQPLYDVTVSVESNGIRDGWPGFAYGIRTVELDTSPIADGDGAGRLFAFVVNGKRIFCKGGNWIPADSIYARVTAEKYEKLVAEAAEANFTMLRIWGGGLYEHKAFYDACDRKGILVWQDFMFACAKYPDDKQWFLSEAEREIDYQTRRLRNHSCLALFCGNNENHWGFHDWWPDTTDANGHGEYPGGARIYNNVAPAIVRNNAPHIPYWRSSPYGGEEPNGNAVGDRHHWHDCTMNPDMAKRITPEEYDKVESKFVSEYGYIGPCCKTTIETYHGGAEIDRTSELWDWHTNTFEKETVAAGIAKHYVDTANLSIDDYLLYAGLVQALMYGYSLESIRCTPHCNGSLFWMYNDCWGEVGWTIIDYYLFRKPSYYAVKRAFAPRKLIYRQSNNEAIVYGVNDTTEDLKLDVEYGYMSFDGSDRISKTQNIKLPAATTTQVLHFPLPDLSSNSGTCFIRPAGIKDIAAHPGMPAPAILRTTVFRDLDLPSPSLSVDDLTRTDNGHRFTVSSDVFAHAVHFNLGDGARYSDEYFDLLPGEKRTVFVRDVQGEIDERRIAARAVSR